MKNLILIWSLLVASISAFAQDRYISLQECNNDTLEYIKTNEAPAPGGIGQQVEAVAGADERGDAGQLPEVLLIGLADVEHRHLHQVFQQRHLAFGILVELVHVEHPHFRQHPFGLSLRGQLQVVGVVACQHVRHQGAARSWISVVPARG